MAELYYLGHSGFALRHSGLLVVFDYFTDANSLLPSIVNSSETVLFLVSHSHDDHFNPHIFSFSRPGVHYIVAREVRRKLRRMQLPSQLTFIGVDQSLQQCGVGIRTFASTDAGCSFAVELGGMHIFHAGDLNNWHWSDESTESEIRKAEGDFQAVLRRIKDYSEHFNLAMFPVDPRMGSDYARGARQFLHALSVGTFVPMHYWDCPEKAFSTSQYINQSQAVEVACMLPGDKITI